MSPQVALSEEMLVSAVRYALGRATYIVSATVTEVQGAWGGLTDKTRGTIESDIREALDSADRSGRYLGMAADDQDWRALLLWIERKRSDAAKKGE